jgi:hypothetical protein
MRKSLVYLLIAILLLAMAGTAFVANAPDSPPLAPQTAPRPSKRQSIAITPPSLASIETIAREITGDPNVLVQIIDGYLYIVYHITESPDSTPLESYHKHLFSFMRRFASISPRLWYPEMEFTARGRVAGNPDAIIAVTRYKKEVVDNTDWEGLTDEEMIGLAERYSYNQHLPE